MGYWFNVKFYRGTLEELLIIVEIINNNCGFPNEKATRWAKPELTTDGDYALIAPVDGWNEFTFEQMTSGINHPISDGGDIDFV